VKSSVGRVDVAASEQAGGGSEVLRATRAFDAFGDVLEAAADDPVTGHRLAFGQTTVELRVAEAPGLVMTLALDREPIEVLDGVSGTPEVVLTVRTEHLEEFFTEEFHLAMAIATGAATYRGPVRKLLRVMPILQSFAVKYRARAAAVAPVTAAEPVSEGTA
jgi:hypothetical protein